MTIRLPPIAAYRLWSATWESDPSAIVALETRLLTPWLQDLRGKVFVDASCGVGRWLTYARAAGATVFGTDLSREMLIEARKKEGLGSRIVQADTRALPIGSSRADVVLCALSLGHVTPIDSAVAELARIVRPGGALIVTDFHPGTLEHGWRRTFHSDGTLYEVETHPYTTAHLSNCAARHGLVLEDMLEPFFGEAERPAVSTGRSRGLVGKGATHPGCPPCALVAAMILRGVRVALGPEEAIAREVEISESRAARSLDLDGMLLLPGLINAHDHLEFSLYPRLGRGLYPNAGAWARDIYHPDRSPVKEQLAIPKRTRLIWGGIRRSC